MNLQKNNPADRKLFTIVVLAMPLVLFAAPLLKGEVLFWGLPATQFVPWRTFAWQQLTQGMLPLWNPLNGLGSPLLANYQLALFYPPGWILYGLMAWGGIEWMAWGHLLVNALHLSWAGLGMMLFVRSLGAGALGQTVSGLAFGLCGYFVARIGTSSMIWAGSWLPWLMLGGNQLILWAKDQRKWFPNSVWIVLTFQLFAGHAQLTWYSILLLSSWVIGMVVGKGRVITVIKACAGIGGSLLLSVGLAAVQLIPTAELLFESQRAHAIDYEIGLTYSFWPWRLLTFLSPDYFGNPANGSYLGYASYWEDAVYLGVIPLILALSSLYLIIHNLRRKKASRFTRVAIFFWIMNGVGLIFALGINTPVFPFLYQYIPTFDLFNAPARYLIWVDFGLAVLAGMTVECWRKPVGLELRRLRLFAAGAAAIMIGSGLTWMTLGDVKISSISATAVLGTFGLGFCLLTLLQPSDSLKRKKWEIAVISVICFDILINFAFLTPSTSRSIYTTNPSELLQLNFAGKRLMIGEKDEYELKFQRFFRFSDYSALEDWKNLRKIFLPNINIIDGVEMVNNFDPLVPARYSQVLQEIDKLEWQEKTRFYKWLNVGVVETKDDLEELGVNFSEIESWGRFRWVHCAIAADNPATAWSLTKDLISHASVYAPDRIVLENSGKELTEICADILPHQIDAIQLTAQKIVLKTTTNASGYLLIADSYFPGWRVTVDNVEAPIYRADYLFWAFRLPQGNHLIKVEYKPLSFVMGAVITGISLIIVIIFVIILAIRQRIKFKQRELGE